MNSKCDHESTENRVCLIFKMTIRISDLKISLQKASTIHFEFSVGKNVISSKLTSINKSNPFKIEKFEFPVKVFYDKRTHRFSSEKITLSLFNHHSTYFKKLGYFNFSAAEMLNNEKVFINQNFKVDHCSDKEANVRLIIDLDLIHRDSNKETQSLLESSYFSNNSKKDLNISLPVIDLTKFDFLKKRSKCLIISTFSRKTKKFTIQ